MNSRSYQFIAWLVPALCLLALAGSAIMATRPVAGLDFRGFGTLPVVANGRVQPLDSLARNGLLVIQGKQRVSGDGAPATPAAWLAELSFRPDLADSRKIFQIQHDDLLGLVNLNRGDGKTYSFTQLRPSFPALQKEAARLDPIEAAIRTPYEKALMRLTRNLSLYNQLKHALALPGQTEIESGFSQFLTNFGTAIAEAGKKNRGEKFDEAAISNAAKSTQQFLDWTPLTHVYSVPHGRSAENWRKLPDSVVEAIDDGGLQPGSLAYARLGDAYRANDTAAFNIALASYRGWLSQHWSKPLGKCSTETLFNRLAPFYSCMILYIAAFICAILSWLGSSAVLRLTAFRVLLIGLALHTLGLIIRMTLEGRPPVTNLYSSAVFIGWGAIILSALIELFHRNAIGTAVASVVGFATLLIAHHLSLSGDTLEMMRAVLDTNFWLATHVVVITLGYSATFLAGTIAIFYLVRRAFGGIPKSTTDSLRGMVYGVICFATLASFVGTVLGGIWADQSWGRFWGWDPKENGAVLIVLWNAIILHSRWGGMIRERGMMVMAVFGNIVTSWSWFGTNMLGIGLHSYGFTDAAFFWLSAFMVSQLLVMTLGFIRERRTMAATRQRAGEEIRDF